MSDTGDTAKHRKNGNTDIILPKRKYHTTIRSRCWFFTFNNPQRYKYCDEILTQAFKDFEKYVFQLEKGEINGTPHIQGFVRLKNARCLSGMQKILLEYPIHWEVCRNEEAAIQYCQKEQTRIGPVWSKGLQKPKVSPLLGLKLRPFQKQVLDLVAEEPNDRTIHWYYDTNGNTGKTTLARHLIRTRHDVLYVQGKSNDIKYTVASFIDENKIDPKIIIWGVPRCLEEYISYEAIESIKDGLFMNGKYESKMVDIDSPHVIIFANFKPELRKLSQDRWNIVNIEEVNEFEELNKFEELDECSASPQPSASPQDGGDTPPNPPIIAPLDSRPIIPEPPIVTYEPVNSL